MDYMKESLFIKTLGNSPKIKVLDFLLDNDRLEWCKSDMAEQTGISRSTLDVFFDELLKQKIVIKRGDVGRATLYKLNKQLPLVKKLLELDNFLTRQETQNFEKIKVKNL